MQVQCPQCGDIQEFDIQYTICIKCGNSLSEKDQLILKNPRKGRGMEGAAIVMAIGFGGVFIFISKFYGCWGFVISVLVFLWSRYKIERNRLQDLQNHDDS